MFQYMVFERTCRSIVGVRAHVSVYGVGVRARVSLWRWCSAHVSVIAKPKRNPSIGMLDYSQILKP